MVDFLARLAERTLRTVPVAQPILTSRFAPEQVMAAPILETEAWSTADAAPMQDAASAFRAEAGFVDARSIMRQGDPPPNEMPTETSILAGDLQERADQSAVGGIGAIHRSLLTVGEDINPNTGANLVAGSPGLSVRQPGFPAFAEEVGEPDSIEAMSGACGASFNSLAPSVSSPQPMISSPQPVVTNQLPTATGQLPEEADTSERAAKELIPAPQARALRLAPASGITSRQGEPVALEQEETVSPQLVADHNNIVPLAPAERVDMSLKRDTSFNPPVEETFDSIVASHSQTVSPKTYMVGAPLAGALPGSAGALSGPALLGPDPTGQARKTYMVGAPLAGALPGPTGALPGPADVLPGPAGTLPGPAHTVQTRETYLVGAPLAGALPGPTGVLPGSAGALPGPTGTLLGPAPTLQARETYMVGAPLAGALPGPTGTLPGPTGTLPALHDQGHAVLPTGDQKGNKAAPSRPQPPSPLLTIGQIDVLPVEQHLLVSQLQLPQGTAPQEQTDGPLINVFPSGSVRNLSRASLAQHNPADLHSGFATASAAEAPPTPPSIQITIGRIDVRAVTSPGPTPPSIAARPSPLLSLDDYLKQGKGGRL